MRTLALGASYVRPARVLAVSLCLSLALPLAAAVQETRPLTLEDYFRVESVGSPALSPDGRQVAFVRGLTLRDEDRRHSEIWLVPADGSAVVVPTAERGDGAIA